MSQVQFGQGLGHWMNNLWFSGGLYLYKNALPDLNLNVVFYRLEKNMDEVQLLRS